MLAQVSIFILEYLINKNTLSIIGFVVISYCKITVDSWDYQSKSSVEHIYSEFRTQNSEQTNCKKWQRKLKTK